MKKVFIGIISLMLSFVFAFAPLTAFAAYGAIVSITSIETPEGREVEVEEFVDLDLTQRDLDNIKKDLAIYLSHVYTIGQPTKRYNCHSYAWYSQDFSTNYYWMDSPVPYFDLVMEGEASHEESDGDIGDIIVYFNSNNSPIHSGIVVNTVNGTSNGVCGDADLKIVQSKWGAAYLYTHRGDVCPYSYTYNRTPGDYAAYVKYYKLKNHTHDWNIDLTDDSHDILYCTTCSITMYHDASCIDDENNTSHQLVCSFCGIIDTYLHEVNNYVNNADDNRHEGTCSLCNAEVIRSHTCTRYVNSELAGFHQGTCTVCNATAYEPHNWVALTGYRFRCTVCRYVTVNITILKAEEEMVCLTE